MNFNSTKIIQILLLGLFGTVFNTQKSLAQTQIHYLDLSNYLITQKLQLLADTSDTNNLTVEIKEINFVGNTAFTQQQLTQTITHFIGRKISFEELLEIETILNKLYSDAGYINSGAVIPTGQIIKDGIVTIQIIEGTIAKIEITGNKKLNSNYIRNRIALGIEKPFNLNQLLESLKLLQLDPLNENISVELSEGVLREASILQVTVTEADSFQLTAIANN
ncbi:MAG: POTRA domain-containing protein, partial [Xenococcaceae cyanobacterium MO_188.B19]|nr:POTRA domain-containing protein [Xenococcaceae cyanobacterium MO_188.B19]